MCTAAIIAGGDARRFGGRDKGALVIGEARIIDREIAVLREVADHLVIVANDPDRYRSLGLPIVEDLGPGAGALGGIYTAITVARDTPTLVVACDMPFLSARFLRHLAIAGREVDVAIPRTAEGYEPLCASYSRGCADPIRRRIDAGALTVLGFLSDVRVREIGPEEIAPYDPDGTLFFNVNTPDDYARSLDAVARQRA